MKMEQSFEVAAPVERVWQALIDVEHVAPCLPGAAVTGRNEDGSYSGTFQVKIGPTTAAYAGKLEMDQVDEASHTARMQAQGSDKRGQGGAKATIVSTVAPAENGGTRVEVSTDYHITGRLARFGRGGMIEDISEKLLRQFADRLQASLAQEPTDGSATPSEPQAGQGGTPDGPADGGSAAASSPAPGGGGEATRGAGGEATAPPPASPAQPNEPLEGGSLLASVLWDRARRNPAPLALIGGLLLVLLMLRRRR
ncbi:MAG: SRPBCC family protein [Solirubrobacterales bacterium]|nr:SRPBCC family protein [Solirubrobacterales bacterium]MBV9471969.1 SRPBCC family protein [Solirubrobacterales bacterium]MBV9839587.1 SRPBCC family protein [Solirubrobacterales bacterium]